MPALASLPVEPGGLTIVLRDSAAILIGNRQIVAAVRRSALAGLPEQLHRAGAVLCHTATLHVLDPEIRAAIHITRLAKLVIALGQRDIIFRRLRVRRGGSDSQQKASSEYPKHRHRPPGLDQTAKATGRRAGGKRDWPGQCPGGDLKRASGRAL